jgi:serine/threonine protein phosphatase PrpC
MADIDRKKEWSLFGASREKDIENLTRALFEARSAPVFTAGISDQNVKRFLSDEDLNFLAFRFITDVEDLWKSKFNSLQPLESQSALSGKERPALDSSNKESVSQSVVSRVNPNQPTHKNSLSSSAIAQGSRLSTLSGVSNTNNPVMTADVLKQRGAAAPNSTEVTDYTPLGAKTKVDQQNTTKNSDPKADNSALSKTTNVPVSTPRLNSQTTATQQGSNRATNQAAKAPIHKESPHLAQAKSSVSSSAPLPQSKNSQVIKPGLIPPAGQTPAVVPKVSPTFHLSNCNVGKFYSNLLEGVHKSGKRIIVHTVELSEEIGLVFESQTQLVSGIPKVAGEFELSVSWSFENETEKGKGICRLTSNPDPRSLWKVNEPPEQSPYPKEHLAHEFLAGNGVKIVAASRRGRSHEHSGSFRDDDFFLFHDKISQWSVVAVADGAGSAKYSREGSRIAVSTAGKFFQEKFKSGFTPHLDSNILLWETEPELREEIKVIFRDSYYEMLVKCIEAIELEARRIAVQYKDFSTTLLVAVSKKNKNGMFVSSFWVGDGAIAAYSLKGTVRLMGRPDSGEFAGQTRFLDQNCLGEGFKDRVHLGKWQDADVLMLLTDGVSDPFFETDNELRDNAKWSLLWNELDPILRDAQPADRLLEWVHFFKQGHHDDRTIAILW